MTSTIITNKYKRKQKYFCVTDYDERLGGKFKLLLKPLRDDNCGTRFFYVKELNDGKYEVTGEGYILSDDKLIAEERISELKKRLEDVPIWYYLLSVCGDVYFKERM